ncbi:MAG: FecR domain-containing protein [Leptospiraceae bacterium]|nr:FecR domain-containing protein [Leptospiraceae bacterium]MCZ8347576.1 FecR domain-containing protein [Leptospiraceae bacterium]
MRPLLTKTQQKSILGWMKEWRVAIILVSNSIIFLTLFYFDVNKSTDFGSREIIGDINFKYNTVKRKFEHQVVWSDLDMNSIISLRDSILTEANSNAVIHLKDGTEIHLEPESMVILDISDALKRIEFSNGSMNILKKNNSDSDEDALTIRTDSGSIEFKNADVKLSKLVNQNLNIGVARGDVKATIGDEEYDLKENDNLNFEGNTAKITSKKVSILNPVQTIRTKELASLKSLENQMQVTGQNLDGQKSEVPNGNLQSNASIPSNAIPNTTTISAPAANAATSASKSIANTNTKPVLNTTPALNTLPSSEPKKVKTLNIRKGKYDALDED